MINVSRRALCQALGISIATAPAFLRSATVLAADMDKVTIGWPSDVPSWDPEQRTVPDAQPIYKLVFDQPLDQAPDLKLIPKLVKTWKLAPDALSLTLDFRDDVKFHDGIEDDVGRLQVLVLRPGQGRTQDRRGATSGASSRMSTRRRRPRRSCISSCRLPPRRSGSPSCAATSYRRLTWKKSARTASSRSRSAPVRTSLSITSSTAASCSSATTPIGAPSRKMKTSYFQIIKDPSARVAAIQSGQADLALNVPVREAERLKTDPNFKSEIDPIERVIVIQTRGDLGFADKNVRLAAHHAIDKAALSKAFYGGAAVPLSVVAPPDTPGYVAGLYVRLRSRNCRRNCLAEFRIQHVEAGEDQIRHNQWPVPRATTISRAPSRRCGRRSGSTPISRSSNTRNILSSTAATSFRKRRFIAWDNATGDPEMFTGYLLNPQPAVLGMEGEGDRRRSRGSVRHRRLRQAHRRLQGNQQKGG